MLFNSISFIIFLPIVLIVFFSIPHRYRWIFSLTASIVFYMFFVPIYVLILLLTIIVDFYAGIKIEETNGKSKIFFLWASVISTCLILFFFKYYNFFIANINDLAMLMGWNYSITMLEIILPIGLSFHTFQSLSYVIEVYRGNQKAERHFGIYALYVMYWPQLVAGPIERPQNLLHQFRKKQMFRFTNFYRGLRLVVLGFFMKLVVADRLAVYVNAVYGNPDFHSGKSIALAAVFFSFQIYCDFAGYSSIALGVSRMMGITLMTNFRRPYFSSSVGEFWRRWHISLSTWFKDYVYISLGGNRAKSKIRSLMNLFVTFLISGFWHGANWTFIIWGGLNGLYLMVENLFNGSRSRSMNKSLRMLKILLVFCLISFSWIFFRSDSLSNAFSMIYKLFLFNGSIFVPADPEILVYCFLSISLIVFWEGFYELIFKNRSYLFNRKIFSYGIIFIAFFFILLFGVFDGGQFIYFQF